MMTYPTTSKDWQSFWVNNWWNYSDTGILCCVMLTFTIIFNILVSMILIQQFPICFQGSYLSTIFVFCQMSSRIVIIAFSAHINYWKRDYSHPTETTSRWSWQTTHFQLPDNGRSWMIVPCCCPHHHGGGSYQSIASDHFLKQQRLPVLAAVFHHHMMVNMNLQRSAL